MDIADQEIIEKRRQFDINDYVPFHFFAGNPFDGRVQKTHPDMNFVFITIKRTTARQMGFKIIPRHPLAMNNLELYDYDKGLSVINWTLLDKRDYKDKECKMVCMAECVYRGELPVQYFHSIGVKHASTITKIEVLSNKILGKYGFQVNYAPWMFCK